MVVASSFCRSRMDAPGNGLANAYALQVWVIRHKRAAPAPLPQSFAFCCFSTTVSVGFRPAGSFGPARGSSRRILRQPQPDQSIEQGLILPQLLRAPAMADAAALQHDGVAGKRQRQL